MQGVVDWVRGKWLIISNVRIHSKTIIMLALKGYRTSDTAQALERAGYEVRTVWGLCGALEAITQGHPSLIIVYSCIPAARICRALRDATSIPILALLTAASEADLLAAFDAGADDCQPASIGAREVLMRTRVLLRRGMR